MLWLYLKFLVDSHDLFFPYSLGLFHWHWGNCIISPVLVKWPWRVWENTTINKTQQYPTKYKEHTNILVWSADNWQDAATLNTVLGCFNLIWFSNTHFMTSVQGNNTHVSGNQLRFPLVCNIHVKCKCGWYTCPIWALCLPRGQQWETKGGRLYKIADLMSSQLFALSLHTPLEQSGPFIRLLFRGYLHLHCFVVLLDVWDE